MALYLLATSHALFDQDTFSVGQLPHPRISSLPSTSPAIAPTTSTFRYDLPANLMDARSAFFSSCAPATIARTFV